MGLAGGGAVYLKKNIYTIQVVLNVAYGKECHSEGHFKFGIR